MWPLGVLKKIDSLLDPSKVVALYHFDSDYTDSSPNARHLTVAGAVSIDTSTKKFGAGAMRLNMSGGAANAQAANVFDFGGQRPFTISYWISSTVVEANSPVFRTSVSGNTCIEIRGVNIVIRNSNFTSVSGSLTLVGTTATQNHIVLTGDGTNIKSYFNGQLSGTTAHPNWPSQLYPAYLGNPFQANVSNLTVDELLIYDGVVWSAPFTPPTAPFTG